MQPKDLQKNIHSRRGFLQFLGAGTLGMLTAPTSFPQPKQTLSNLNKLLHYDNPAIGYTPILKLRHLTDPNHAEVWVKWEGANPTGSMKDRMALGMIESAEKAGKLKPGMRVIEMTGGSTGSSLAMVCSQKGYKTHFVTTDAISMEKRLTMKALGAHLDTLPSHGHGISPELVARSLERIKELNEEPDTYWTNQFGNSNNALGYHALGHELKQFGHVDAFVMGVGTGGCITGVATVLKASETGPQPWVVAVEPAASKNLSGGPTGSHRIEGIGIGFVPETARLDLIDEIEAVSDEEAFQTTRDLARYEGWLAGPSSGANVAAAKRIAKRLGKGKKVVTLLCDSGLRYLSLDLFGKEKT
ncbi:PLP-dependent cysteine synthase family protein [Pararhodonellum marinum]|uniref:PLP-dependent cysteine synthase family protein n=1 Tax=Pararhodonellum marinum TaxID=2755358 RepID=UPI00188FFB2C|nr:cysteine synthase family protein [Pararhodonellum marinum]